jgi:hypothetical protein
MNQMVQSGLLYRTFSHAEVLKIQKCITFFNQTGSFVVNKINQVKAADDFADGRGFANYVESECRRHLETIHMLKAKR